MLVQLQHRLQTPAQLERGARPEIPQPRGAQQADMGGCAAPTFRTRTLRCSQVSLGNHRRPAALNLQNLFKGRPLTSLQGTLFAAVAHSLGCCDKVQMQERGLLAAACAALWLQEEEFTL